MGLTCVLAMHLVPFKDVVDGLVVEHWGALAAHEAAQELAAQERATQEQAAGEKPRSGPPTPPGALEVRACSRNVGLSRTCSQGRACSSVRTDSQAQHAAAC